MSDMNHVNDGRTDAHLDALDALDAAELWQPEGDNGDGFPLSYDEWLAARLANGQPAGEFDEYLADLKAAAPDGLSWNLYFIRAEARRGEVTPLTPEEMARYKPPF